jgi:hypothetical protein
LRLGLGSGSFFLLTAMVHVAALSVFAVAHFLVFLE